MARRREVDALMSSPSNRRIRIYRIGVAPDKRDSFGIFADVCSGMADIGVENYSDFCEWLEQAADGALHSDNVMIFEVAEDLMSESKSRLAKSLNTELVLDRSILNVAEKRIPEVNTNVVLATTHAGMIVGGKKVVLADGLYGGFCCRSGNQEFWLLPADPDRSLVLLTEQVVPEINRTLGTSLPADFYKKYAERSLLGVCSGAQIRVSAAGTGAAEFLSNIVAGDPELRSLIRVLDSAQERHGADPAEYACDLAVTSSELGGSDYGCALTNVFIDDAKGTVTTYLAVAAPDKARILKLCSPYGEGVRQFLDRAAAELLLLIAEVIGEDDPPKQTIEKTVERRSFISRAAVAVCVILAAASVAIAALMTYYSVERGGEGFPFGEYLKRPTVVSQTTYPYDLL